MIQGHGDDIYKYNMPIVANFSTNVWFACNGDGLKQHLIANWNKINSYPEPAAESLVEHIAQDLKISAENIMATNGATEAFYLIAQCFKNQSSTIVIPTFSEYEDACKINEHSIQYVLWKDFHAKQKFSSNLIWICNPNNPTGDIISKPELNFLLDNNKNSTFVIDEAYIDFTNSISSAIELIDIHRNLILVKSLTKNFNIPGLRLGYLISNRDLVQNIQFYKAPWTVNSLAIEAGKYLLQHKTELLPPVEHYESDTQNFIKNLNHIPGLKIHPTKTSYFLIELEKGNAEMLKNYLISEFGILIRDAGNFRGLNSSYLRVATQSEDKNQLLIDALQKWSKLNI